MDVQVTTRRRQWALLALILLAFALRVVDLGQIDFWHDESLSFVTASKGPSGIIEHAQTAPFEHPPLYFFTLYLWMQVAGASEFALRFLSVFWGVLLVPLLYRLLAPWGGYRFAFLAALVTTLSVLHIDQSQNARMYTMVATLGVLSLLCFFRALSGRHLLWWVGYLAVIALGIATHYYFALMLLVPLVFLLLSGPHYRRLFIIFSALLVCFILLIVAWFLLSPGPYQAILETIQQEGGASASTLWLRVQLTVDQLLLREPVAGHLALVLLIAVGIVFWPLAPLPRTHPVSVVGSRRFLLIWLVVPWLAALAIPYWVQGRHLAYLWPVLYALMAAGLLALRAKGRLLFAAGLLLVIATSAYGLYLERTQARFQFGDIMGYIEDRALPGDQVVLTEPGMWSFVSYYNQGDLAVAYVPAQSHPLAQQEVDRTMSSLVAGLDRIWLGPIGAWTSDPDSLVEQWLATRAFQVSKEWFEGSGSAALYYSPEVLQPWPVDQNVQWEAGIYLMAVEGSAPLLSPGDALRLSLTWQASQALESRLYVSLHLVDETGRVWAVRQSEPCGGWCPTDSWEPVQPVEDHHALLIPPGTPPGSYRVLVGWYALADGRVLGADGIGQWVDLGEVRVGQTEGAQARLALEPAIQYPLEAEFGEQFSLQGFDLPQTELPAGDTLALDLHWFARSSPSSDYLLRLELVDAGDQVVVRWDRPPVADFFPTSQWQSGQYLRGLQRLPVPGDAPPGRYRLRLALLDADGQPIPLTGVRSRQILGGLLRWDTALEGKSLDLASLRVLERPERSHGFNLPAIAHPLQYRLGQQVELLGYDLAAEQAGPGGQIELTLYWRGRGPTRQPYKVFTHLGHPQQVPLAQDDKVPGNGCCPTDTWVEGEVVVDRHVIRLPVELAPGTYSLTTGMYDENSGGRLPAYDAEGTELDGQQVLLTEVVIPASSTPGPGLIDREMPYRIFLPVVESRP